MTRLEGSIEIRASPERIWPLLDCEEIPKWYPNIKSQEWTSEAREVGATYHVTGEGDGQSFEYDAEITEHVENSRVAWRTTGGDWTALGSVDLEPTEARTKVTMVTDYQLPYSLLGKIIDRLSVRRSVEKALEDALENLKSMVEE